MNSLHQRSNADVAAYLEVELRGSVAPVEGISPFPNDRPNTLSYLARAPDYDLASPPAGATVISVLQRAAELEATGYSVIEASHPKHALARVYRDLLEIRPAAEVHPTAVIGPQVIFGNGAAIGPGSVLQGEIVLGDNVRIGANTVLTNRVVVGDHVQIRNGCVIGEDAYSFGFVPDGPGHGQSVRFPSVGRVVLGDHVEIGNNCVVSRGVQGDTVLRAWSRVNDLAHIGNTVDLGRNSMIMANCDISARVRIGEGSWIAQSAVVLQGLSIGDGAQVGMGAVVTKDVPAGKIVTGVPARVHRDRFSD